MSRLGKSPIAIPAKVEVSFNEGKLLVKGALGQLNQAVSADVAFDIGTDEVRVRRLSDSRPARAMHGLYRQLLANMVIGVSVGCQKTLEIIGVGYRAESKGRHLILSLGFSTQVDYVLPDGIECKLESPTKVVISGIDKQKVGQVASEIRSIRPPEPYKGKGVRYAGERVRIKAGKSGA